MLCFFHLLFLCSSQPWFHSDWIYFLTPSGRKFLKYCREVHAVAEEVIQKRRKALVSVCLYVCVCMHVCVCVCMCGCACVCV